MSSPIRVLIVDDSALMRHRLSAIVGAAPGYEVAGAVANGAACLAALPTLRPDIVTLDVEMPGMDGLDTLRELMRVRPTPVVMVSSLTESGAATTLDALSLGAVDYLAKPSRVTADAGNPFSVELLHKLSIAAQVRHLRGAPTGPARPPRPLRPAAAAWRPATAASSCEDALVAIGSSTGGPQALDTLISSLPDTPRAALLIVQHMPPLFTRSLATRLARHTGLRVREVEEGDRPEAGLVLIARGGRHMILGPDGRLRLDESAPVHGVRPAIDLTWASIAEHWKGRCLAVVLTGMGCDGTEGARLLRARGADVFAQDEGSSIVYGMPRAVAEAGLASAVLPLDELGPAIERWTSAARPVRIGAVS